MIELFFEYDAIPNPHIWDMDKIYLPLLSKHRKIMFENEKYNGKIASKGEEYALNWETAQKLKESFDAVIAGLLLSKKQYEVSKKKKEEKERERQEIVAAEAERRRASRKRDQEVMAISEVKEDYDVDEIESNSFRRNHNVRACTTSTFFYFFLLNNFFFVVINREQMLKNQRMELMQRRMRRNMWMIMKLQRRVRMRMKLRMRIGMLMRMIMGMLI